MAFVVGIAVIITQEFERVIWGKMLRVLLHEFLYTVPESWDSLDILVQADHEAVLLLVLYHEFEWIIVHIAEEFNARLNSPVPFVVQHQWLAEEEARLKSAHVSVAYRITIDNLPLRHVFSDLARLVLIDPWWERPVLFLDLAVMSCT